MLEFFSLDSIYRNQNEKRFTQKILKSRGASSQKIIQMMDSEENLVIESKSTTLKYCLNIIKQNKELNNDLKSISKEYFVGSIAYVFKAKLKNHNGYIAIKVLRENIEEKIKSDFNTSSFLTKSVNSIFKSEKFENLENFTSSFIQDMIFECNLIDEERNYLQFKKFLNENEILKVPKLFKSYTTKKIICYEWIEATHTSINYSTINQELKDEFSTALKDVFIRNALQNGVIQEDSNPANLIVSNNKIFLIDFGKIYKLPLNFRIALCYFIHKLQTAENIDYIYHYSLLGYDKKSLEVIKDYLPVVTEILLAPFLTSHLTVKSWNPSNKLSVLLGDLKWILRSAGGITNFKFTRSLLGLYKSLDQLDVNISSQSLIIPVIESYKSDFKILDSNNKTPHYKYNLHFDSRKVCIHIKKMNDKETKVTLPINALYSVTDFLSDETLNIIKKQNINLPDLVQKAINSQEDDFEILNISNSNGSFKITVIS